MDVSLKRTTTDDEDFKLLVKELDHELWVELKEDQATYDQFNNVINIPTAVVVYISNEPVACGCFKKLDVYTVEIKRMFVRKNQRGKDCPGKCFQNWNNGPGNKTVNMQSWKPAFTLKLRVNYILQPGTKSSRIMGLMLILPRVSA